MAPAPSTVAPSVGLFSLLRHANFSAPPKRPAPPEPASAPRAKRALTLDSPTAMLPPGAPSASESSLVPPSGLQTLAEGESTQSNCSALMAPALESEEDFEPTDAELAAFLAEDEVVLETQSVPDILGSKTRPARASPEIRHRHEEMVLDMPLGPDWPVDNLDSEPAQAVPANPVSLTLT